MKKAKIVVVIAIIISIFGTITSNHICFADTPSIYESENKHALQIQYVAAETVDPENENSEIYS